VLCPLDPSSDRLELPFACRIAHYIHTFLGCIIVSYLVLSSRISLSVHYCHKPQASFAPVVPARSTRSIDIAPSAAPREEPSLLWLLCCSGSCCRRSRRSSSCGCRRRSRVSCSGPRRVAGWGGGLVGSCCRRGTSGIRGCRGWDGVAYEGCHHTARARQAGQAARRRDSPSF
jgi:hypothetical protein